MSEISSHARYSAIRFEMLASMARERAGFVVARSINVGLRVVSRGAFLMLGAAISTGDFVHAMLTQHPNRRGIESVIAILEGKEQAAKVWQVLCAQWLTLPEGEGCEGPCAHAAPGDAQHEHDAPAGPAEID